MKGTIVDALRILGDIVGRKLASKAGRRILRDVTGRDRQNYPFQVSRNRGAAYSSRRRLQSNRSGQIRHRGIVPPRYGTNLNPGYGAGGAGYGTPYGAGYQSAGACRNNDQAILLIRAMISAAKADGQIDSIEYNSIAQQTHGLSQREIAFLQQELNSPIQLGALVASVPRGLEMDVYKVSLATIRIDSVGETQYLRDLSQSLGLCPKNVSRLHRYYGLRPLT